MSADGTGVSTPVTRNRSATLAVARSRMLSHTAGRHATTDTVRRVVCRSAINPWATCSSSVSPASPGCARDAASSVSIWSTASTDGPTSATRREISRTHSCVSDGAARRPQRSRSSPPASELACRYASPMSWAVRSVAANSTSARSV